MKSSKTYPSAVAKALIGLGADLSEARRRRRITAALLADRAGIHKLTLRKIERGDPGVSMGAYASTLFAMGLLEALASLAAPPKDSVGLSLESERLPKRVRLPRRRVP